MNWDQLRAIIWLRWRLTRNQFARAGAVNAVLSIFMVVLLAGAAFGFCIGGLALGIFAGAKLTPSVLLLIWDGAVLIFLLAWLSGLMIELQRSESIDLNRLLHLPVTLNQVFIFNYAASHLTPSILLFVPAMLAFCAGLMLSVGPIMALLIPLVIAFILMITAWTYCLRGWLAALMMNKRRRRAILVWVTILLVLLGQMPNLIFNSSYFRKHRRSKAESSQSSTKVDQSLPEGLVDAHLVLPPGWVGYSAMALRQHRPLPVLPTMAAAGLLAALGLLRAYRLTIRFYLGADEVERPKIVAATSHVPFKRALLVERRLPWLPDDTAALTLATLRSLLRAPELKMVAILPVILGVVMFMAHQNIPKGRFPHDLAAFAATAAVALATFSFSQPMSNFFGLDRNGFRTLVLLPTQRHAILLAKNLAFFPLVAVVAVGLLILAQWLAHISWLALLTAIFQIPTAFLLFSLMTNLSSILVPYRISQTLKAKKPKAIIFVAIFLSMLLTPIVMFPVLLPAGLQFLAHKAGWPPQLPVGLIASLVVLAMAVGLYRLLLPLEGELLQRREQAILREVTEEVE